MKDRHYCLYCDSELDFIPSEDGGFCSADCEDNFIFEMANDFERGKP